MHTVNIKDVEQVGQLVKEILKNNTVTSYKQFLQVDRNVLLFLDLQVLL